MDPIYVSFYLDEPTFMRLSRAISDGRMGTPRISPSFVASTIGLRGSLFAYADLLATFSALAGNDAPLQVGLQGEEGHPHHGAINFIDNQVNPGTGSILVRGVLANPLPPGGTYLITPGMFVRVRLPIGQKQKQLLVIDRAIISDQGVKKVYVVEADNKVKERTVTLGALQEDGLRVVTHGLKKDDWVVVGGIQQVRPRMEVQREELTKMPGPTTATDVGKVKKK
jgi:multidrug efflux system membrane fusion protein